MTSTTKKKLTTLASNAASFALGFTLGAHTTYTTGTATGEGSDSGLDADACAGLQMLSEACTASDSESSGEPGSDSTDVGSLVDVPPEGRVPNYCDAFPDRCNITAPCPERKVLDDGSVIGGCFPVDTYVCCNSTVGCWAVHWAADCVDGGLYWSSCDAGESAIDPETGKAIILCHD